MKKRTTLFLAIPLLLLSFFVPGKASTASANPLLSIDAALNRHAISPEIYGINWVSDETFASEINLPANRWGGNHTSRYNWQYDTFNRASDWYFMNYPEDNTHPENLPDGSAADHFVEMNQRTGAKTVLTVPILGWTPKSRDITCSFSVSKYGAQQAVEPYHPDCGNGIRPDGVNLVTGNDPTDTSVAIGPDFDKNWLRHLTGKYGQASANGVQYYALDNEPMLWNSTHRDVHPTPTSYDELRDRTYQYAPALKEIDPSAKILGPVLWGWTAYFYSAKDWAAGGSWWDNPIDRNAHGGTEFVAWYLQQMLKYEQQHGLRILDDLDLHYYPQANNVSLTETVDPATKALRLRSTRSLWDPTYTDESWIGQPVQLIPRMHNWVNANYPSTKVAITEYNWGAFTDINGALAESDVLGIFGRESVDLAMLWGDLTSGQPVAYAFRMYRSYDGKGGSFGNTSVKAVSSNQEVLSIYAAIRGKDGALTVIVINKSGSALTSTVSLANFQASSSAHVYRYSPANLNAIQRLSDQPISGSSFTASFPVDSITLFEIPPEVPLDKKMFLPITRR